MLIERILGCFEGKSGEKATGAYSQKHGRTWAGSLNGDDNIFRGEESKAKRDCVLSRERTFSQERKKVRSQLPEC